MTYSQGVFTPGTLQLQDQTLEAQAGITYEILNIPERTLTQNEMINIVNGVYVQRWFEGAQVTWMYADEHRILYQFIVPNTSSSTSRLLTGVEISLIISAVAALITAIVYLTLAVTAYKVVSSIAEAPGWMWAGAIIIGVTITTAVLIRAIRGK